MQRHLPGIFRRRMLVLRLIPLAQGPPSESARIPRLPHRPHFWAAAATGAGATRRSAPHLTYAAPYSPQEPTQVRFPCPHRLISCLASAMSAISTAFWCCLRAARHRLTGGSVQKLLIGTCLAFSTAACWFCG
jgi:hypothetical protein